MLQPLSTFRRPIALLAPAAFLAVTASATVNAASARTVVVQSFAGERPIASYMIDRRMAPSVASLVRSAGAYAMPLGGGALPRLTPDAARQITPDRRRNRLHFYGGPTLSSAKIYNIYVNQPGSYWGSPDGFINNWNVGGTTTFQHVLDQYTSTSANGRYPYGGGFQVSYNTSGTLGDQDMYNIIHPIAAAHGTGYGAIYHVYFAKGVNQCSNFAGGCYGVSGGYCAYHGSVNFSDIGHTIYSFEGFQNINGCSTPNGQTADSTDSTMSHEMYEAITDPDVNNGTLGWYSSQYGEIGDICRFNYGNVVLNAVSYNIQKEWSNSRGMCTYTP